MVYQDDRLPENSFFCYQLTIYCCAADAQPVGVLVEYHKRIPVEKGGWVKVEGIVGFAELRDDRLPKITAEKVEAINPPKVPYLLP
jgi:putative membrane protein